MELRTIVRDFARGLELADAKRPRGRSRGGRRTYRPGIGPIAETIAVRLTLAEMAASNPERYSESGVSIPYPSILRQRCDLCVGSPPSWDWAIEVKVFRLLGDNGKPNDNMVMHIISPYARHHSALTDCAKLSVAGFGGRLAILIYAFDDEQVPAEPAIQAFESLASNLVGLGARQTARFSDLIHPVHREGRVFGWEILRGWPRHRMALG
jgi:hypothetical protein